METPKKQIISLVDSLLRKTEREGVSQKGNVTALRGGSDRSFYRLGGKTKYIAMIAPSAMEITEYIQIQKHLQEHGVEVPEIFAFSKKNKMVVMEDIGTRSLKLIVRSMSDNGAIERLYERVIKSLIHLQFYANEDIERCKPVFGRVFDYDVLRWESQYFKEEFLEGICGFSTNETSGLETNFHRLALTLASEPLFFMHRDFQSTNIFIKQGKVRIIDFQSAHRGMLSYDLAALLRDAYVNIERETRDALFYFYYSMLQAHTDVYRGFKAFRRIYVLSAIQRNMQALGAFAFLSQTKKKKWFLKAIPWGLQFLREGLDEIGSFRQIKRIVDSPRIEECVQSMDS